ncbi:MAG: hypothetical protein ICV72_06350 [Aldersonia sp.]|nr:hypothetical protein [Aldersonia sp.]
MTNFSTPPAFTLGNGVCAAVLQASGNGFDGPLWQYSEAPGATHGIIVRITQGFSPLGEWAPSILTCDMTAVVDWHNLDTGARGSESRHMPWLAQPSIRPTIVPLYTGRGRVQLTLRTAHPNIPASTEVFVP